MLHSDSCLGHYIYVHNIPSKFNHDLLKDCQHLNKWADMCSGIKNHGFGPKVLNLKNILSKSDWYSTNQFTLELIFEKRMKRYKCLTNDSSLASAIYVPYYPGLDVSRYLWDYNPLRDVLPIELAKWLSEKPEWKRMYGRDHFFIAGRIGWDFRRGNDNWGSNLMLLPEFRNMTMLTIESTSWSNEFAIPYPTHFHPRNRTEIIEWQKKLAKCRRKYLFSFVGAPRPNIEGSIRGAIITQCRKKCKLLDCGGNKCENPIKVMRVFQRSIFCLQPQGDSFTRRSIFDSILSGCIPVFFHPFSAYAQYIWYLPKNYSKYSVFIPEDNVRNGKVSITEVLSYISDNDVKVMRKEIIGLIPKIVYGDFGGFEGEKDAFLIAVNEVIKRVNGVRKRIKEGLDPGIGFGEVNSWKLKLNGVGSDHEFDGYF